MALTRKFLSALGIESDKIDEIIDAHTDTVDGLKEQRDAFKADAEKVPGLESELEEAKSELTKLQEAAEKNGPNMYKTQYDDLKAEFDQYKADQEAKELLTKKTDAYRELLKEAGVSEKRFDSIVKLKSADFDSIELDDEGKIKDASKLKDSIKEEWSDFIVSDGKKGADVSNPPANGGGEKQKSRAAMLAAQYNANLYGSSSKEE